MGPRGLELVVGAKRDADWGPVVLVGLGGVWIEALKDVRLIPADMAEADIVVELGRLKAASVLNGIRGAAAVDVQAIARVVALVGRADACQPADRRDRHQSARGLPPTACWRSTRWSSATAQEADS